MPRQRKEDNKTSHKVYLEGENFEAVEMYHTTFKTKKQTSVSKTINKIIDHWRSVVPPALRGAQKP